VDTPPREPSSARTKGVVGRARSRAEETWSHVEDARPRIPALDAAFDVRAWDQEVGGGLLAGALAFRLFLWLVPFAFVAVLTLGRLVEAGIVSPQDLAQRFGVTGLVAQLVGDASQLSTNSWFALLIGVYALYLASLGAVRALRIAHVLAWRMPITRFHGTLKAALWFIALTTLLSLGTASVNALRQSEPGPSILLLLVLGVCVGGLWLVASSKLPHPADVPIAALIPGAIVFALGTAALHLVTVVWYAHKVAHATELYGSLGAAVGLLAWLYLLGRLTIASAVINASLWRRRAAATGDDTETSRRSG
jgi:uncharacterized BrkB/YihY/UPF0761 family membrane protein